jgi:hypothetical protein
MLAKQGSRLVYKHSVIPEEFRKFCAISREMLPTIGGTGMISVRYRVYYYYYYYLRLWLLLVLAVVACFMFSGSRFTGDRKTVRCQLSLAYNNFYILGLRGILTLF